MENLLIEATKSTPEIDFNYESGILTIKGQSYPENSFDFYKPIIDWIKCFLETTSKPLEFIIEIKYMNTSSIKSILNIFDILENVHEQGRDVAIRWYYDKENDSIKEVADEFKEDISVKFDIIEKEYR